MESVLIKADGAGPISQVDNLRNREVRVKLKGLTASTWERRL